MTDMLTDWLRAAITHAKMTQGELAQELTARLGRSIDRVAVNKMLANDRKIVADELLEIANITKYALPIWSNQVPSEFETALKLISENVDLQDGDLERSYQLSDHVHIQLQIGDLKHRICEALEEAFENPSAHQIELVQKLMLRGLAQDREPIRVHHVLARSARGAA